MTDKEILLLAEKEGFSYANVIDTSNIVFNSDFRAYCEENLCGQYGANYSCPPDCGTTEAMKQLVLNHKKALVLQMEWKISDIRDGSAIKHAKGTQNTAILRIIRQMKTAGHNGIMVGSSCCSLCEKCAIAQGEPCKFPEERFSCMSAHCIHVKKLAESCDMTYDYKNELLPLFGMIVFD